MVKKNWLSPARGIIRMSMSKYNSYNLANKTRPTNTNDKTLYQQQWQAKKETRGYHDAEITEKQWKKLFATNRKLPTANTNILDGARHPNVASLTYACLERRLDFIVYRALFASSILEAKQLILHGKVMLNGVKTRVSSTLAKNGDIITVDPKAIPFLTTSSSSDGPMDFKPKPFSQPHLFLPSYLEVDYSTCSVVFIREPVSKAGKSELPSPYPTDVHKLAYEFYAGRNN